MQVPLWVSVAVLGQSGRHSCACHAVRTPPRSSCGCRQTDQFLRSYRPGAHQTCCFAHGQGRQGPRRTQDQRPGGGAERRRITCSDQVRHFVMPDVLQRKLLCLADANLISTSWWKFDHSRSWSFEGIHCRRVVYCIHH